jgi:non-specific serine/threonine protein kinase
MPSLTPQLLQNFPYTRQVDARVLQRGRAYFKDARVREVDLLDDRTAVCQVMGDSGNYQVGIQAVSGQPGLAFSCDCPYADEGYFCKHMVAAALELTSFLEEESLDEEIEEPVTRQPVARPMPKAAHDWQYKLGEALDSGRQRSNTSRMARYVGLVILERLDYYGYGYSYGPGASAPYTLTPYIVQAADWPALAVSETDLDRLAINALLETDRKWARAGKALSRTLDAGSCLNLNAEAVAFLNVLVNFKSNYYGYGRDNLPMLLSLLSKLELPVFKGSSSSGKMERRLHIIAGPVDLGVDLRVTGDRVSLSPGIERDGQFSPIESPTITLSQHPAWVLAGDAIIQLSEPQMLATLGTLPIHIPAAEVDAFREDYLARLAQTLPLREGLIRWQDMQAEPMPRLYLCDDRENRLRVELRFDYGGHEVPAAKTAQPVTVVSIPDTWDLVRVHRQGECEAAWLETLADPAHGLKRGSSRQPYGTYVLRARVHPFDFLLDSVPRLAQAGFEIYGEETLKVGKVNRSTPVLRVAISSGIDWFDLKTVVEFGDQQISLRAVRQALQRGQRFIKLADGSAGQIPADWLEKYRHLWKMATETPDGYRVRDLHLPLLDALLEDDPAIKVPAALQKRRERLRSFEQIVSQPLPENFNGELRPYQKHGVDWLHFLYDFKFGGILADDMGLGKTVQVLAFLQLLKERARRKVGAASLLVVPKSLMVNWQREAGKFTPGLRFLPYVGNVRDKDTASFKGYDIVLTTYGTLLRDIDSLRQYKFRHIILDESQAIKNPLAKSAKAARLLTAEHRLVLTGTPVENNTLELWSQFAFLNPDLLGGMDFFRREFATPIESRGDEAAAATLRRLVYPFILRRTKEQVAPELPPRTERILYTDMDSAQKKLYAQTRDRYRAELLGLIERQGLNDARFKVLEGLLRLRQIAIHPGLVDSRYTGEVPKLEILLETLETLQAENHKALIFSQFVGVLRYVRKELEARGLRYVYLDGQTTDRQARVDVFQTDPTYPFFLISLKAGGVGLNLTAADYVIHLDPWWNPAVEMQASDRAHRIGQDKPVFIYKLIARDTVEEKILQLQEKKRALVKSLVTTEVGFIKSLTPDDVKLLFE